MILSTDEAYWQIVSLVNRKKLADKCVETLTKFVHDVELMYTTGEQPKRTCFPAGETERGRWSKRRWDNGLSLSRMLLNPDLRLADRHDRDVEERWQTRTWRRCQRRVWNGWIAGVRRWRVCSWPQIYIKRRRRLLLSEYLLTIALTANYLSSTPSFFDGGEYEVRTECGAWESGLRLNISLGGIP